MIKCQEHGGASEGRAGVPVQGRVDVRGTSHLPSPSPLTEKGLEQIRLIKAGMNRGRKWN